MPDISDGGDNPRPSGCWPTLKADQLYIFVALLNVASIIGNVVHHHWTDATWFYLACVIFFAGVVANDVRKAVKRRA